jgi:hypothetical protein
MAGSRGRAVYMRTNMHHSWWARDCREGGADSIKIQLIGFMWVPRYRVRSIRQATPNMPQGRHRLGATYPHTPRARSTCAYLVLLRVEIARFTRCGAQPRIGWLFGRSLRRGQAVLTARRPTYAGPSQSTPLGNPVSTRLCCSDPHLTVDSR